MSHVSTVRLRLWIPAGKIAPPASLLRAYQSDCCLQAGPAWARRCAARAAGFLATIAGGPGAITRLGVRAYLARLHQAGASPRTLRNHLSAIHGLCRFLRDLGALAGDPSEGVRGPAPEEGLPHYIHDEELPLLMDLAVRFDLRREVLLDLNTGLRMNELRMLAWSQWHRADRMLAVLRSKGRRPRMIPLNRQATAILQEQHAISGRFDWVFPGWRGPRAVMVNHPRGYDWWARALAPITARHPAFQRVPPGQTGRAWHLIRHTYATRLVRSRGDERGVELAQVGIWMGHKNLNTTRMYAHYAEEYDPRVERLVAEEIPQDSLPLFEYNRGQQKPQKGSRS